MTGLPRWPLLVGLLAVAAPAQEFELDLSGDGPAVPVELRPTLAVLEVVASDGDPVSVSRAKQLEGEVLAALQKSEQFKSVITAPGTACVDFACFQAAATKLSVHRATRITLQKSGVGSLVTVSGFDPAFAQVSTQALDSEERAEKTFFGVAGKTQAQKDREFLRKMVPMVVNALKKLATANGKLVVENGDPGVKVLLDGVALGSGRVEAVVQRGLHSLTIDAPAYEPFGRDVSIEPLKTASVTVTLKAKPVAVQKQSESSRGVPILKRPGLYVALAGAVLAGVGFGLGASSQAVQQRIDRGGVPVGVTRAEAQGAATSAVLANVLVATGGAALVGGVTWIILTPTPPPDPNSLEPTDTTPAGPSGLTLSLGGTF
ncbi:MAG TPA: PEGA domain-containing protein [Archangium sp.]